jgi:hypothetical protein
MNDSTSCFFHKPTTTPARTGFILRLSVIGVRLRAELTDPSNPPLRSETPASRCDVNNLESSNSTVRTVRATYSVQLHQTNIYLEHALHSYLLISVQVVQYGNVPPTRSPPPTSHNPDCRSWRVRFHWCAEHDYTDTKTITL